MRTAFGQTAADACEEKGGSSGEAFRMGSHESSRRIARGPGGRIAIALQQAGTPAGILGKLGTAGG